MGRLGDADAPATSGCRETLLSGGFMFATRTDTVRHGRNRTSSRSELF